MTFIVDKPRTRSLPRLVVATLVAGALLRGVTAYGGAPEQKCQGAKNRAAGKYAACRQNAEAKLVTSGNTDAYTQTILRCEYRFASTWEHSEAKAMAAGTACPDDPLDQSTLEMVIDECTGNVATALAGGGLPHCPADLATCESDLAACEAEHQQGQQLKTGQTTCYDISGTVIACAGTGQDGELRKGLTRSYTDNGDGTITDSRTGLMWEKLSDDGSIHDMDNTYTWNDGFAVKMAMLNGMGFGGYSDWRVPNVNELQSLQNYGAQAVDAAFNTACTPGCSVTTCSCASGNFHWSSTTLQTQPSFAVTVIFATGGLMNASGKGAGNFNRVRAVRSAITVAPRFVDHGNGTVTDNQTGLQWEKKETAVGSGVNLAGPHDVDNNYTWGNLAGCTFTGCPNGAAFTDFLARLNNCVSSNDGSTVTGGFAGHCDWRLPSVLELETIRDTSQGDCAGGDGACIDPIFGPTYQSSYWTASTHATDPTIARIVYFNLAGYGNSHGGKADPFGFLVRAVRAGL